jgi:hypothetical protein
VAEGPPGGAGLIASAIKEGNSVRGALREYREAGGSIRTQTFERYWYEVKATTEGRETAATRPLDAVPAASELLPWANTRPEAYSTQVEVFVRDKQTGEVRGLPYTHFSDEPITGRDATEAAEQAYGSPDAQEAYEEEVLGASVVGTYENVPLEAEGEGEE